MSSPSASLLRDVRLHVFRQAAATGRVPQPPQIAGALELSQPEVEAALNTMLLFRDEEHVDRWCRTRDLARGATLTPEQGWRLAKGWYKDKLKPDWRRHTVEEAEALLAEVGLTGAFWNLRG